jgi:hypothetical protein
MGHIRPDGVAPYQEDTQTDAFNFDFNGYAVQLPRTLYDAASGYPTTLIIKFI